MKLITFLLLFIITVSYSQEPTEKEINWLKKQVIPLNTSNPNSNNNDDLESLDEIIGNAQIVALGEVTHGSSEIYKMKHRITKYLATKKEFDIFSLEANMPEASQLNTYINGEANNPKELLKGMYFWVWQTQETLDLVNWMKEYKKMKFSGFDMQYHNGALKELSKFNVISKSELTELDKILSELHKKRFKYELYFKLKGKNKKIVINTLNRIKNKINTSNETTQNKEWLLQNCKIVEQYITKINKTRDKYMAKNVLWLKEHNPNSKIILSAHNGHIQNSYGAMGNILKDSLKNDYLSIGFAINTGTFTSIGKKGLSTYKLQDTYEGTYEYYFKSIDEPMFILDLRKLKQTKANEWLFKQQMFRIIGAASPKHQFGIRNLTKDYDIIIFINKSTNSKLLHKKKK